MKNIITAMIVASVLFTTGVVAAMPKNYEIVLCRHFKFTNFKSAIQKVNMKEHINLNWNEDSCHIFATKINLPKHYSKNKTIIDDGLLAIVYVKYKKVMLCLPGSPVSPENNIHCYPLK